jgi:hypothetical protein
MGAVLLLQVFKAASSHFNAGSSVPQGILSNRAVGIDHCHS